MHIHMGAAMSNNPSLMIYQFASWVVNHAKTNILLSIMLMAMLLMSLPKLYKDTRADAFLADDNPALLYRDKVKAQFGLSDPIVVAIVNQGDKGVFNPKSLALVDWLTRKISLLKNINADRVTSLATENNITGSDEEMEVELFFETFPTTQFQADKIWQQVSDFPLYMGSLVAKNKKATVIVAELINEDEVEATYQQILQIVGEAPVGNRDKLHVAGEGAIAGYLGSYIDADAKRLNPMAGIIITLIILFAFRRISPGILSNVIIAASVLITLSVMAASNIPFYVITNALPVILIGISVADSVHIYSHYFELHAKNPDADKKNLIIETVVEMWRPITLTTLTTIAGFIGLFFAAYMPPFKYFGLFTAIGVAVAWLYSLVFLPAAMALTQPSASQYFIKLNQQKRLDRFAKIMVSLGNLTLNNPKKVLLLFTAFILAGLFASSHLIVNEDRIETFHHSEPLYQADKTINQHFDGSNYLDIVIETKHEEGLFEPHHLQKIERLQDFALKMTNVQGAVSIVDYLKQMNRSLNGGDKNNYRLPNDKDLIAQYFLLYSASSDPTDFEEEIDYDYRIANMRLNLNRGGYLDVKPVVEALDQYLKTQFDNEQISATLSGRATVNYHWIKDLGESHFVGLAISLFLVWLVASLLFRSFIAGLYTILPVASSLLIVYAAMVALNIDLGIGTSMFASVAIGLGVDFAIHTIDRLRSLFKKNNGNWEQTLVELYPSTGRALFFNYLAIACGFGVLISSQVIPLNNFGTIVVVSVSTSFLASLSLLPALIKLTKPRFIAFQLTSPKIPWITIKRAKLFSYLLLVGLTLSFAYNASTKAFPAENNAHPLPDAIQLVKKINKLDDGRHTSRKLLMRLTDKRNKTRERETVTYRKYFGDEKRTILFYKKPSNVKGTAFLTFDYPESNKDDDQWLYIPALRKVRRISASDRGDYFLGTDFTYEDIKLEGKWDETDYYFKSLRRDELTLEDEQTSNSIVIEAIPQNAEIAAELGYGKVHFWVDQDKHIVVHAIYWDEKNNLLKTLTVSDIRVIDNIVTRHKLVLKNHQTGHRSEFIFSEVDYTKPVKDNFFSKHAMKKGL